MRMRKKKHGPDRLQRCAGYWIEDPTAYKNQWESLFSKQAPLFVEIGCGKGRFVVESAKQNPDINYVAVEQNIDVLVLAAEKAKAQDLPNVKFLLADARDLGEIFGENECSRIYLNFSDPWHKHRHFKRRLTYKSFLEIYKGILKDGCPVCFKTDNRPLFDFSLQSFQENGFRLENLTYDLHNSGFTGNIMTEYEILFSSQGHPIYRVEAYCGK